MQDCLLYFDIQYCPLVNCQFKRNIVLCVIFNVKFEYQTMQICDAPFNIKRWKHIFSNLYPYFYSNGSLCIQHTCNLPFKRFFFMNWPQKNMANKNWKQKTRLNAFNHHLLYTVCLFCMCVVWDHNTNKRVKKKKTNNSTNDQLQRNDDKGQTNKCIFDRQNCFRRTFFSDFFELSEQARIISANTTQCLQLTICFFLLQSHQIATLNDFQKMKTQIISVYIETVNSWIWTRVRRSLFLVYQPRSYIIKKRINKKKQWNCFRKPWITFFYA